VTNHRNREAQAAAACLAVRVMIKIQNKKAVQRKMKKRAVKSAAVKAVKKTQRIQIYLL